MFTRSLRLVLLAFFLAAGCGDDGFNELPDGPTGDSDSDGIPDELDNCPNAENADQVDTDSDGAGDACDDDDDNDGVLDGADNCPLVANPNQANGDGDTDGDACDGDADGDGVADGSDNCPTASNLDQLDTDSDLLGDACDPDDDNDTILDVADNCVLTVNLAQTNTDADALGDACDDDDDNDTVLDTADNCPLDANTNQLDTDADLAGDACDPDDDDNDSVLDGDDNCVIVVNGDQSNLDADSLGDACDDDDDGDDVLDTADNCPGVPNADQADTNQNGHGDACDGVITPSLDGVIRGGNLTSVGKSFSAREDGIVDPSVDLVLTTVPATALVVRARIYWTVIGTPFPTLTFAGTSVTGIEIGQTPDTCWGRGNNFAYQADVTSLVTANGTFTASNLISATTGPDGQGISLVVVYADSADTRNNLVQINDGAIGFVTSGATSSSTATGFTIGAGFDKVTAINVVADGQTFEDNISYQGSAPSSTNAFSGADGALWDTRVDDISSVITGGATSIVTTIATPADCLAWSMSAIVVEDIDDTVVDPIAIPPSAPPQPASKAITPKTPIPGMVGYRGK